MNIIQRTKFVVTEVREHLSQELHSIEDFIRCHFGDTPVPGNVNIERVSTHHFDADTGEEVDPATVAEAQPQTATDAAGDPSPAAPVPTDPVLVAQAAAQDPANADQQNPPNAEATQPAP